MAPTLDDIRTLFDRHGNIAYSGKPATQLEHALQTATLAEATGASDMLVTAALLYGLNHLLNLQSETPAAHGIDDQRQYFALPFLRATFPDAMLEPIRLHVDAKCCLCAMDAHCYACLSVDSVRSLALQGGALSTHEAEAFMQRPYAADALQLRQWDDLAKVAGQHTPKPAHFLATAARVLVAA